MSEPQNKLAHAYAMLTEHIAEQVTEQVGQFAKQFVTEQVTDQVGQFAKQFAGQFADQFADHLHRMISKGDVCGTFEVHPRQLRDLASLYPSLAQLKLDAGGWHVAEAAAWVEADVPRLRELLLRRWDEAKVEAFVELYNSERPRPRPGRRKAAAS
jgi:hypothetical protein